VALGANKTRGCVLRTGMLAMVFKLTKIAEQKWHKLKGRKRLAQVVQDVKFKDRLQEEAHKGRRLRSFHTRHLTKTRGFFLYRTGDYGIFKYRCAEDFRRFC